MNDHSLGLSSLHRVKSSHSSQTVNSVKSIIMEESKTSPQDHLDSSDHLDPSVTLTPSHTNELVFAFRLGKLFNRFHWHLKWGVFTFNLSENAPVWDHLESLLAELVKLHPGDANDSPVKKIRSWRDEVRMLVETESAFEHWQSCIEEIRSAALTGNTDFESIRAYFRDVLDGGEQIKKWLRSFPRVTASILDPSLELSHGSFDLGAGLDMAVMPQLDDLEMKKMLLHWDEKRNPPATLCSQNNPEIPPGIPLIVDNQLSGDLSPSSNNGDSTSAVIRSSLNPYAPPVSEINRLKSLCNLLGISATFPRFQGTVDEKEKSLNHVEAMIEHELNDKHQIRSLTQSNSPQQYVQRYPLEITDVTENHDTPDSTPSSSSVVLTKEKNLESTSDLILPQSDPTVPPNNISETLDQEQPNTQSESVKFPELYPHLTDYLDKDDGEYRDTVTENRDKFLYTEYFVKSQSLSVVFHKFNALCVQHEWDELSNKIEVSTRARIYAARMTLPIRPRKKRK